MYLYVDGNASKKQPKKRKKIKKIKIMQCYYFI